MRVQLNTPQGVGAQSWDGSTAVDPGRDGTSGRVLNSTQILAGRREVIIEHEGAVYRLRHTKNGKLILTK